MIRKFSVYQAVILVFLTIPFANPQAGSLIVNGSFEEGPNVGSFVNLPVGSDALPGWIVTGEGVDYVSRGYWVSSDGARAVDLDGSARSAQTPPYVQGGIAQTFPTSTGVEYRVTFDLAGNPNQLPEIKPLRVSAAGQSVEMSFDARGRNGRDMGWRPVTWTFTASGSATTLEFTSLTVSPQTGFGAAIDNVAVVAVSPRLLDVTQTDEEIHVALGSEVFFDTGRFDLKPAATEALRGLATLLEGQPDAPAVIEGHTDSVGSAESNRVLSENRAGAVRDWLVSNGIPESRLTTRGFGATVPLDTNETPEGRQRNRRVEVRIRK